MFGKIRKAYNALRLLSKAEGAWKRGLERGGVLMDKPMLKSATVWGAILLAAGTLFTLLGQWLGGSMDFATALPKLIEVVGMLVVIIGGRRAIGGLSANGGSGF